MNLNTFFELMNFLKKSISAKESSARDSRIQYEKYMSILALRLALKLSNKQCDSYLHLLC